MTDNLNVDNSNLNGGAGSPNQALSEGEGGSIKDASELSKLLDAKLSEALKPILSEVRGVQGRQDKDRSAFKEFMDEFKTQKAKGLSDDQAQVAAESSIKERTEAQNDKVLLRQVAENLGISPNGNGAVPQASVIDSYELDANDPEVISQVLTQTDPKDAELAALRLKLKRSTQPIPSPSAASSPAGSPSPIQDEGQKVAKLSELQKNPSKNREEINKLEKELGWQ